MTLIELCRLSPLKVSLDQLMVSFLTAGLLHDDQSQLVRFFNDLHRLLVFAGGVVGVIVGSVAFVGILGAVVAGVFVMIGL